MKKKGVSEYKKFALEVLKITKDKPVSFEIFADGGSNDYIRLGSTTTKTTSIRMQGSVLVTGSMEVSGSNTFTNWGNFRNRLHNNNRAFEVSTNPYAAGGFKEGQSTPTPARTGSAPHLHFMLSGSGQAGVGTLSPQHTLHVSESSANFNALQVEGNSHFNGWVASMGGVGNQTTISQNITVPNGYNLVLWTSNTNPSITINTGINYTISAGADVTVRSVNF